MARRTCSLRQGKCVGQRSMGTSRKQITFDLNQESLELHYPRSERAQSEYYYRKAYQDIRKFMGSHGFVWQQSFVYISQGPMTTMDVVLLSQRMAEELPWLKLCVKEITATDIGAQHSLLGLLRSEIHATEILPSPPAKGHPQKKKRVSLER